MDTILFSWVNFLNYATPLIIFMINLLGALLILIAGVIVARYLRHRFRKSTFAVEQIDATLRPVMASVIFYFILAMTLYAVLTQIGIPETSLLAIFGAAGLAIGLALKDTLGNIASGLMLLFLRPIQVGEYVNTPSFAGTIAEIGLFATTVINSEGVTMFIPNSQVWANRLNNFARHTERKFIAEIGVGYGTDLRKVQKILDDAMTKSGETLTDDNPPEVYVTAFGDSAVTLSCRCWLPSDNWLRRSSDMRILLKETLDKAGIEIPFPQRVVTRKS